MEAITREEQLLNSIATKEAINIDPITREEQYLAYIAGLTDKKPEKAITRKEMFYDAIAENGAGGGDGTAKPEQSKTVEIVENGDYEVTPDNGKVLSSVTAKVNVPDRYEEGFGAGKDSVKLQEKTVSITENGTTEVTPDEGKTLSKVTVNTSVVDGEIGKPYIDTSQITDFVYFFASGYRYNKETARLIDTSNGTNFSKMFYQAMNLEELFESFDTSKGTAFREMFYNCKSLIAVPQLDTSKGTDFGSMFRRCETITTIPQLDTSNGTDFSEMFETCYNLVSIPQLDTSNGIRFSDMFYECHAIKEIPLLDLRNANSLTYMCYGCENLETISLTTAKSNLATNTFQNCTALKNITIGEGWAVNIYLHYSNELTVESLHGMIENLADLTGQTAKTFQVGETNLAKIDEEHLAMLTAKNWSYS